jgi:biofilm protein TabA
MPSKVVLMILGTLIDSVRYYGLLPGIQQGFEFLQSVDLPNLPDGRIDIDGQRIFAIIARGEGRGPSASALEYHRRYADIQYVIAGDEVFGWSPTHACRLTSGPFDVEQDIGFFRDGPSIWCPVRREQFVLFLPEDAHAPLAGTGPIHKVVVKVQVAC